MQVNLVNESKNFSSSTLKSFVAPLQQFCNFVTTPWEIPKVTVISSSARILDGVTFNVCVVDLFPDPTQQAKAYGYHEYLHNQPIAYIRADSFGARNPAGDFLKQLSLFGKVIRQAEALAPGVFSVICHETAEGLLDPTCNTLKKDAQGRQWIMEVCDHTVGKYLITANGVTVVAPDFTYPSFYNVAGHGPFSFMNVPTAPFTLPSGAYGYTEPKVGEIIPLTATSEALDHE